jgi:hypothetical protein
MMSSEAILKRIICLKPRLEPVSGWTIMQPDVQIIEAL